MVIGHHIWCWLFGGWGYHEVQQVHLGVFVGQTWQTNDLHDLLMLWLNSLYPSTHGLHGDWNSFPWFIVTPRHAISGVVELWEKIVMCNCHCNPCANRTIDSLCFWSPTKIWAKFCGSTFSIICWVVMEFVLRVAYISWMYHVLVSWACMHKMLLN